MQKLSKVFGEDMPIVFREPVNRAAMLTNVALTVATVALYIAWLIVRDNFRHR